MNSPVSMVPFNRILNVIFSTSAAGLYLLLFAISIGAATFIENDFGTSAAQKLVFRSLWFEVLLVLFGLCIVWNIIKFRMIQQKKWAVASFHFSIILILIGAGVTRYFGYEGMMHIREGSASNTFLSSENYIQMKAFVNGKSYTVQEPALFASLGKNSFKKSYLIGGQNVDLSLREFIPNPTEMMEDDPEGVPCLKLVLGGAMGREEYVVKKETWRQMDGFTIHFGDKVDSLPADIEIQFIDRKLTFRSRVPLTQMVMATQKRDSLPADSTHPLLLRSLYSSANFNFVISEFNERAQYKMGSSGLKMTNSSDAGLKMQLKVNEEEQELFIVGGQGSAGTPRRLQFQSGSMFELSYGSREVVLPFQIALRNFIMERYPGTDSPASYESEVTLIDKNNGVDRPERIYMNHILNYEGYRFFQSSYDKDELGTYLSVNYDAPGTLISYLGYIILTLGLILSLFSKNGRFYFLRKRIESLRAMQMNTIMWMLVFCGLLSSQAVFSQQQESLPRIQESHAAAFSSLVVQDFNGRMKPVHTLTREVFRKISRRENYENLNADQWFLSMTAFPEFWNKVPIIKIGKHEKLEKILNPTNSYISYFDLFDAQGEYKLREETRMANNKKPVDRDQFDKEILKLDERINIVNMIFTGSLLRLFPVKDHPTNLWESPSFTHQHNEAIDATSFPDRFHEEYVNQLRNAVSSGSWTLCDTLIFELGQFQKNVGSQVYPMESKLKAEILLNELDVFGRLGKTYGLLSLVFLALLFASVFKPSLHLQKTSLFLLIVLVVCFLFQTMGLGLRWYVSGRAPWSNGYESMIYISWTTVLAGLLFSRKSLGGLAATCMLSSIVLMVAGLSWLDPEITPLVPVLKSYWLTIHVSLEAGSYGFLVLGALIGALNLVLMIFISDRNQQRVKRIIEELGYTSEITLMGGLCMLSIGTYLGGVWANESWGRYWGWDAKETWALVSILVYSFILHMRLIPGLQGKYAYNVATLFGFATVMMTYFGVNYYLSGLHSYAAGDPVPIPTFVYYTVGGLVLISVLAYWRTRKFEL